MDLQTAFQAIEATAVVVGVGFAMLQVREHRRQKRREAAIELLHSFQSTDFARALNIVYNLPDGLSREELERHVGHDFPLVYALMTTWESLGILVYRDEVPLELVDDFFSGPIVVSWRKLRGHVEGERRALERETIEEWFQWLAERFIERETGMPPVPAHVAHRHWKPRR